MKKLNFWLYKVCFVLVGLISIVEISQSAFASTYVLAISSAASQSKSLSDLQYPERDVSRFAEAMLTVGGVQSEDIFVLRNPSIGEVVESVQEIQGKILRDQPKTESAGQKSKFVFYFSGHSDLSGLHLRDGTIPKKQLHDFFDDNPGLGKSQDAVTKIYFLDSCFSGALAQRGLRRAEHFQVPKLSFDEPTGSVFLTASAKNEVAFESERYKGGVFTHYLISGLYGDADFNGDSIVSIDELYQHVYRET